jgi:prepilin-type N-terminal cleavage/methylation domain-containing protein
MKGETMKGLSLVEVLVVLLIVVVVLLLAGYLH